MRDVSCVFLSTTIEKDSIGVEKETKTQIECPIIKNEAIYEKEFYSANEQGLKPSLRLRISSFNYNGETELVYMGVNYTIIRTQQTYPDEIVLVCERKVKNV